MSSQPTMMGGYQRGQSSRAEPPRGRKPDDHASRQADRHAACAAQRERFVTKMRARRGRPA